MKDDYRFTILLPAERALTRVLVVEPNDAQRERMVLCLKELGFRRVSASATHAAALSKFDDRQYTHILFSASSIDYPMLEWLDKVFEFYPSVIAIATTANPSLDDVFSLMMAGSRGFLVKPFARESLDYVVSAATRRDPLSDKVRQAGDPIAAILGMIMTSLDNLAIIRRHANKYESARRELGYARESMKNTTELFRLLTKSKQKELISALEDFFVKKGTGPASPLGRLRKRLRTGRTSQEACDNSTK